MIYGQAERKIDTYILNVGTVLFLYFAEPVKMKMLQQLDLQCYGNVEITVI